MITVTIGMLKNPGSKQLTDSFQVVIESSAGNPIDSVTNGLSVAMDSIGQLASVLVEPDSKVNGEVTPYKFQVITNEAVSSGDKFKFDLPSEITVPMSVSCTGVTNVSTVSCTRNVDTIVATLTFPSGGSTGGLMYEFKLNDVENPPSTAPTSAFANIFMTDSDGFEKA